MKLESDNQETTATADSDTAQNSGADRNSATKKQVACLQLMIFQVVICAVTHFALVPVLKPILRELPRASLSISLHPGEQAHSVHVWSGENALFHSLSSDSHQWPPLTKGMWMRNTSSVEGQGGAYDYLGAHSKITSHQLQGSNFIFFVVLVQSFTKMNGWSVLVDQPPWQITPWLSSGPAALSGTRDMPRGFFLGDPVYAQNYGSGPVWVPARVARVTGHVSHKVSTDRGLIWSCHIDQLRRRLLPEEEDLNTNGAAPELESSHPMEQSGPSGSQSQEEAVCLADNRDSQAPAPAI